MGIRRYFKGAMLARMSSGTYCIIRPLGLVKGGKGLKHHENLLTLTAGGIASKLLEGVVRLAGPRIRHVAHRPLSHSHDGERPAVVRIK